MKTKSVFTAVFVAIMVFLGGCVKQPTMNENVVDNRPGISFKLQSGETLDDTYLVYVDNLAMGSAARYVSGESALRILSGSHLIRVERNGVVVYEQTFYLGDGAIRDVLIPDKRIEMVK